MNRFRGLLVLLLAASCLSCATKIAAGRWISLGAPEGATRLYGLAFDRVSMYATFADADYTPLGVWRYDDAIEQWVSLGLAENEPLDLQVTGLSSGILVAGTYSNSSVHVSTDRGETWTPGNPVPAGSIYRLAVHPQLREALYGVNWGPTLRRYRSVNVGATWTMYSVSTFGSRHLDIEVARGDPNRAYVLTTGPIALAVEETSDGGATWNSVHIFGGGETFDGGLAVTAHYPSAAFVCTHDRVAHNIGGTWTEVPIDDEFEGVRREIVLPEWSRDTMFLAGGAGTNPPLTVIRTTDMGFTWTDASEGLPGEPLPSIWDVRMVASPSDGRVALGLMDVNGRPEVWVRREQVTTSAPIAGFAQDRGLVASPVPSNAVQRVLLCLPDGAQETDLAIYDAQGRKVRSLLSGPQAPGKHAVVWDGRGDDGRSVPSGVYFYRLAVDDAPFQQFRTVLLR